MVGRSAAQMAAIAMKLRSLNRMPGTVGRAAYQGFNRTRRAVQSFKHRNYRDPYSSTPTFSGAPKSRFKRAMRKSALTRFFLDPKNRKKFKRRLIMEGLPTAGIGAAALGADYAARRKLGMIPQTEHARNAPKNLKKNMQHARERRKQ